MKKKSIKVPPNKTSTYEEKDSGDNYLRFVTLAKDVLRISNDDLRPRRKSSKKSK